MRVLIVWIVLLVSMFVITVCFYAFTPVIIMLLNAFDAFGSTILNPTQKAQQTTVLNIFRYEWIWMVVLLAIGVLIWAFVNSQKKDYESYAEPVSY